MYAIIETGGKQIRVEVGQQIFVEKLEGEAESEITFDKVLLIGDKKATIGTPYVKGATVVGKIVKQGKSKKIRVFKYKNKHNYHRTRGHRQPYTCVVIESINA